MLRVLILLLISSSSLAHTVCEERADAYRQGVIDRNLGLESGIVREKERHSLDTFTYRQESEQGWSDADQIIESFRDSVPDGHDEGVNVYIPPYLIDMMRSAHLDKCNAGGFRKTASNSRPDIAVGARIRQLNYCIESVPRWTGQCTGTYLECVEEVDIRLETCIQVKCKSITDEELGIGSEVK